MYIKTLVICSFLAVSCGKSDNKKEDSQASESSTEETGDETESSEKSVNALAISLDNEYAQGAPLEAQVSVPTQSDGKELQYSSTGSLAIELTNTSDDDKNYLEKLAEIYDILSGEKESDCLPDLDLTDLEQDQSLNCYDRSVSESDNNPFITFPANVEEGQLGSEPQDGTAKRVLDDAAGFISSLNGSEPCSVATAKHSLGQISRSFFRAQKLVASLMCLANLEEDLEMPSTGDTLDLTDLVADKWADYDLDVLAASIQNNQEGSVHANLRTILSLVRKVDGHDLKLIVDVSNVIPNDSGEETKGRIMLYEQTRRNGVSVPVMQTMNYHKEKDTIGMSLKMGTFNFDMDPADSIDAESGMIDFEKMKAAADNHPAENIVSPFKALFKMNVLNGTGSFVMTRAPSLGDGASEAGGVFALNIDKDDEGIVSGCAISGHTDSFLDSKGQDKAEIEILGKFCLKNQNLSDGPAYGNDLNKEGFASFGYVQQQCISLNDDGKWQVDSDNLNWVVAEKCGMESNYSSDEANLISLSDALKKVPLLEQPTVNDLVLGPSDYKQDFEYVE